MSYEEGVSMRMQIDNLEAQVAWLLKRCDWYKDLLLTAGRTIDSIRGAGAHDGDIADIIDEWDALDKMTTTDLGE